MTNNIPLFEIGQHVYFRESAALGHLESVVINGMVRQNSQWLYTIRAGSIGAVAPFYGDRKTTTSAATLYFTEDEFVLLCDALELAEANAVAQLNRIREQKSAHCDNTD